MGKIKFYHFSGAAALIIATCSAIFSVYGLSTLFAGAQFAIIIMASALELGKILSVSMVYNYAKKLPKSIRRYLTAAVIVLMLITSLGVAGYLTNAYQQSSDAVNTTTTAQTYNTDQQNLILDEINNLKQQIADDVGRKDTLNKQRDAQETRLNQAQTALNRRMQTEARNDIKSSDEEIKNVGQRISDNYKNISEKNKELRNLKSDSFKIREQDRKIDVGPLRYLSKLFAQSMDSIVIFLILILVLVFDPLAIVLWLSTNALIKAEKEQEKRSKPQIIEVEKLPDTVEGFKDWIRKMYSVFKSQKNKDNPK